MYKMRRTDREMDSLKVKKILENSEYGILSTVGSNNWPYGIPLSFVVLDDTIYFHSATIGHKISNLKENSKVCFNVVGYTKPVYKNNFTTYYESVVAFGKAYEVESESEKRKILAKLCLKYLPDYKDKIGESIEKSVKATAVYGIKIEHLSGKENPKL